MHPEQHWEHLQLHVAASRKALLEHPVYSRLRHLEGLQIFMQHHVFAVWDFMSLLKALQRRLCGGVPWLPPSDTHAARFVNEIVVGEETDEDGQGGFASHFELYRHAMLAGGASTEGIDRFLDHLGSSHAVTTALDQSELPESIRHFVNQTFAVIEEGDVCAMAAAFTLGREDLLPDVFERIVQTLNQNADGKLDAFLYYLQRHIELDGDHHGPMAARMMMALCGEDATRWHIATEAAQEALASRLVLWNGIEAALCQTSPSPMR